MLLTASLVIPIIHICYKSGRLECDRRYRRLPPVMPQNRVSVLARELSSRPH